MITGVHELVFQAEWKCLSARVPLRVLTQKWGSGLWMGEEGMGLGRS